MLEGCVRGIGPGEIDAWCACPLRRGDPRRDAWVAEERAWLARWRHAARNLFVFDAGGDLCGKYDVARERPGRWELWAPTVRDGPHAPAVMAALCHHIVAEARQRRVCKVELTLEGTHRSFEIARKALGEAGFRLAEERVVVRRDLTAPLPPEEEHGLEFTPAAELAEGEFTALCRAVGMAAEPDPPSPPEGIVARRDGRPVGLVLLAAGPRHETLTLHHIGIVEGERGKGSCGALLLHALRRARSKGASSYLGSTAKDNAAMRRVFLRLGCRKLLDRFVYAVALTGASPA